MKMLSWVTVRVIIISVAILIFKQVTIIVHVGESLSSVATDKSAADVSRRDSITSSTHTNKSLAEEVKNTSTYHSRSQSSSGADPATKARRIAHRRSRSELDTESNSSVASKSDSKAVSMMREDNSCCFDPLL